MTRVDASDWAAAAASLDAQGWAVLPGLLSEQEGGAIAGPYDPEAPRRRHCRSGTPPANGSPANCALLSLMLVASIIPMWLR